MFGMIRNVDFCVQSQKINEDWPSQASPRLLIGSIRLSLDNRVVVTRLEDQQQQLSIIHGRWPEEQHLHKVWAHHQSAWHAISLSTRLLSCQPSPSIQAYLCQNNGVQEKQTFTQYHDGRGRKSTHALAVTSRNSNETDQRNGSTIH